MKNGRYIDRDVNEKIISIWIDGSLVISERNTFMEEWKQIRTGPGNPGSPLRKFTTTFNIFDHRIPSGMYKIHIYEYVDGSFFGSPNISVIGSDGYPGSIGGSGNTVTSALKNTIRNFIEIIPLEAYGNPSKFIWDTDI